MAGTSVQDGTEQKSEQELRIQENADGTAVIIDPNEAEPVTTEEEEDDAPAPVSGRSDADDGPTEAEELRTATDEAAREAIRARRRRERKERKLAAVEREQDLRRQLEVANARTRQLEERFNVMDRKTSGAELAQLDNAIRQGQGAVEHFTQLIAQAASTNNGAAQADAVRNLMLATKRVEELGSIRQQVATPRQAAPTLDPVMVAHAQGWMTRNAWYDPQGNDDDSRIVLGLDQGLVKDGFQPNTPAYWGELDKRVLKYLPHRKPRGADTSNEGTMGSDVRKPVRSVVTGSGREAAAGGRASTGFTLSAERVQALKDAGMWSDPAQRNAMIKDFREYDRKAAEAKTS